MSRVLLRLALLALAFAAGTTWLGWGAVPFLGAVWGVIAWRARDAAWSAAMGAVLGWGALLLWAAASGPVGVLAQRVGGIFGLPGSVLVLVTLIYAAALAWSAAAVGRAAMALVDGATRRRR